MNKLRDKLTEINYLLSDILDMLIPVFQMIAFVCFLSILAAASVKVWSLV